MSFDTEVNKSARTVAGMPRSRAIAAIAAFGVLAVVPFTVEAAGEAGLQRGDAVTTTKETPKDFTAALKGNKHVVVTFLLPGITEDEIVQKRINNLKRDGKFADTTFITYRITGKTKLGDLPAMLDVKYTPTVAVIQGNDKVSSVWRGLVDEAIVSQAVIDARKSTPKPAAKGTGAAGNPEGVALAKKVNAAYAKVPGVEMAFAGEVAGLPAGAEGVTAQVKLDAGKFTGMRVAVTVKGQKVATIVNSAGIFAQAPGKSCWIKAPATAAAFGELNTPILPMTDGVTYSKPVKKGANLVLTATGSKSLSQTGIADVTVNAKTMKVVSVKADTATITFTDMDKAPAVATPKPVC